MKPFVTPPIRALFFGPPGSGKSVVAATACDDNRMGNVLYCDWEGNTAPFQSKLVSCTIEQIENKEWKPEQGKLNHIPFSKYKEFPDVVDVALDMGDDFPFETIIIDSIGFLNDKKWDIEQGKQIKKHNGDWKKGSYDIYGEVTATMRQDFQRLSSTGLNFVIICHSKEKLDAESGITMIQPRFTGDLQSTIPGGTNISGYIQATKEPRVRRMFFSPTNKLESVKNIYEFNDEDYLEWKKGDPFFTMLLDSIKIPKRGV